MIYFDTDTNSFSKQLNQKLNDIISYSMQNVLMYAEVYVGDTQEIYLETFAHALFDEMDNSLELAPQTIIRKFNRGSQQPEQQYYETGGLKSNMLFKYTKPKGTTKGIMEVQFKDETQHSGRKLRHRDVFTILDMGTNIDKTSVWIPARPVMEQAMERLGMDSNKYLKDTGQGEYSAQQVFFASGSRYYTKQSDIMQQYSTSQQSISASKNMDIQLEGHMVETGKGTNEWEFEFITEI